MPPNVSKAETTRSTSGYGYAPNASSKTSMDVTALRSTRSAFCRLTSEGRNHTMHVGPVRMRPQMHERGCGEREVADVLGSVGSRLTPPVCDPPDDPAGGGGVEGIRDVQRDAVGPGDRVEGLAEVDVGIQVPPGVVLDGEHREGAAEQRHTAVGAEPIVALGDADAHRELDGGSFPGSERLGEVDGVGGAGATGRAQRASGPDLDPDRERLTPVRAVGPQAQPDPRQRRRRRRW